MQIQGRLQTPSPTLSSRLQPQWKTFQCRETHQKTRSVKKPTIMQSFGTKRVEQYETHMHTQSGVRCGYTQVLNGSIKRQRTASLPGPIKTLPSISIRKRKIFFENQAGSTNRQQFSRSYARIQMRSQEIAYYNHSAHLWRLRAGPFSIHTVDLLRRN